MYINATGSHANAIINNKYYNLQKSEDKNFADELNIIDENLDLNSEKSIISEEENTPLNIESSDILSESQEKTEANNIDSDTQDETEKSSSKLQSFNLIEISEPLLPTVISSKNLADNNQIKPFGEDNINQSQKFTLNNSNFFIKSPNGSQKFEIENPQIKMDGKHNGIESKVNKTSLEYINDISNFIQTIQKKNKNELKANTNEFSFLNTEIQKEFDGNIQRTNKEKISHNIKAQDNEFNNRLEEGTDNKHSKPDLDNNSNKLHTAKQNIYLNNNLFSKELRTVAKVEETVIRYVKPKDFADVTFRIVNNLPANSISNARISLNPPSLGKIIIAVRLINDNLSLNIKVENKDVLRIIENQIPYLRDKLQLAGIKVENLELNSNTDRQVEYQNNSYTKQYSNNQKDNLMREFIRTFREFNLNESDNNDTEFENQNININNQQVI